ncbi:MAG: hypothetical protein GY822_29920 [Deltaproteobacteria bacterium]|nr:hypothetical protein [Deltaproteobacteria bacterium]
MNIGLMNIGLMNIGPKNIGPKNIGLKIQTRSLVVRVFFLVVAFGLLVFSLGCEGCTAPADDTGGQPAVNLSPDPFFIVDGGGNEANDGGSRCDAGSEKADAGTDDAGEVVVDSDAGVYVNDAGVDVNDAGVGTDAGSSSCDFSQLAPEGDRVVVVSHPFGNDRPWDLRTLELKSDGSLADVGSRFSVGQKVRQLAFVPSGEVLLALGEDGDLYSFWVDDADTLTLVDTLTLPDAGFDRRIEMLPSGDTALIANFNSSATSGIFRIFIQCDGSLLLDESAFFPLRLISAMTLTADESRLILVGGQATFKPVDPDELRIFSFDDDGFQQVASFDFFQDLIMSPRISIRDDGLLAVSISFDSTLRLFQLDGDVLSQIETIEFINSLEEVLFSPDGESLLVSSGHPTNSISLLTKTQNIWSISDEYTGVGLADQIAILRRGPLAGVFLPGINAGTGQGEVHHVDASGAALNGQTTASLGNGTENSPWGIAVQP